MYLEWRLIEGLSPGSVGLLVSSTDGLGRFGWVPFARQAGEVFAALAEALADLVLPRHCAGCAEPGSRLCGACDVIDDPVRAVIGGLPVVAGARYAGTARTALLAYKERGRRDLAAVLAATLAQAVAALLAHCGVGSRQAVLVCVPSTRAAVARRGGDHLARLARGVARRSGVRVAPGVLRISRGVHDSAGLSAPDRAKNLAAAMLAVPCTDPARVVIVLDDIVSSGTTLLEAQRALRAAGWPVLGAAAFAATPLIRAGNGVEWHPASARSGDELRSHPLAAPSRRV